MIETSKPIDIFYLITDLRMGGAQRMLINILMHLDRDQFSPKVVCLLGGESLLANELLRIKIDIVNIKMNNKIDIFAIIRLFKLLRVERPIILHSSLFHANFLARILGRVAKIPIIITWRQNIDLGGRQREFINRVTKNLDDCIVAVSKEVRNVELQSTGVDPDKVVVIYNSIDTTIFKERGRSEILRIRKSLGISKKTYLIGTVCRLHPQKGVNILLEAFDRIRRKIAFSKLIIVGDGELRNELEEQAKKRQITDRIIFTGTVSTVPEILAALDVFILTSRWEGLPLALLEAMASHKPVIATAVGGTPEAVVDGITGILVPPNNPQILANEIERLSLDQDLRKKMGHAGRKRIIENFSIDRMVAKTQDLYQELLVEKGILF